MYFKRACILIKVVSVKCFTEMTCVEVCATSVPDGFDNGREGAGISKGRGSSEGSGD